jgi:hypothetical protein
MKTRRQFLKLTTAAVGPTILGATNKSVRKHPVVGSGEHRYEVIHDWGQIPTHIKLGNTHGIVEDSSGHIYLCHTVHGNSESDHTMLAFDEKGQFIKSWGGEFRGGAHGLHLQKDAEGEFLYLTDTGKGRRKGIHPDFTNVVKMALNGEEVFRIGYPKHSPYYGIDSEGQPATKYSPTNIAIAENGDIYIGDGYGAYRISHYKKNGEFIRTFGEHGKKPGQLWRPHGLIVDKRRGKEELLVADRTNNRLQYFSMEGKYLRIEKGVNRPCHFDEKDGVLLIPDLAARVTLMDRENQVIAHLGEDTTGDYEERRKKSRNEFIPGKFICPHGACFDHKGNIFVAEWVEIGRITKLRKVS